MASGLRCGCIPPYSIPLLLVACGDTHSDTNEGLSRVEVEVIVREQLPAAAAAPEPGLSRAEVERIVQAAVTELPRPATGLTRADRIDGQWYVFIVDENDKLIGHYDAHLIGEDLNGPIGVDANGYNFAGSMLDATEEGKWVSYVFSNPESEAQGTDHIGTHEYKHVWVVRHDGLLLASGWYVGADVYTRFFVEEATSRYHDEGLEATAAYYNRAGSVGGQWFAFLADGNGKIIAHYVPDMLGGDLDELLGTDSFSATPDGSWVTHSDVNPSTGEIESKHAWVVAHDGLVFGSGWYHGHLSEEN